VIKLMKEKNMWDQIKNITLEIPSPTT